MPVVIARAILEQHHHEQGEGDGAPAQKCWAVISWNHAQAREAVQEDN
jgi:hypothetical protein